MSNVELADTAEPTTVTDRKLASIREISEVSDIVFTNTDGEQETAQNIVRVKVDGWQLVTQRNNGFKPGDKVVYFEIDSLLPSDNPEFAFLEKYNYRLKTIKLKGQISQGLVMPLSILPWENKMLEVGDNVTDILGVTKYEPPIPANLRGVVKGNFPGFLIKTDEERLQNIPEVLALHKDKLFCVTEKLDGTSCSVYLKDGEFGVCSRNLDLKETADNKYWQTARQYNLENILKTDGRNLCIQGEIIGVGIQGNKYKLHDTELCIFYIYDIDAGKYFNAEETFAWCGAHGLSMVPIVEWAINPFSTVEEMLGFADGCSAFDDTVPREGLVWRNDDGDKISFKTISNKFLLKHE